jgi:hypothetical protein
MDGTQVRLQRLIKGQRQMLLHLKAGLLVEWQGHGVHIVFRRRQDGFPLLGYISLDQNLMSQLKFMMDHLFM